MIFLGKIVFPAPLLNCIARLFQWMVLFQYMAFKYTMQPMFLMWFPKRRFLIKILLKFAFNDPMDNTPGNVKRGNNAPGRWRMN